MSVNDMHPDLEFLARNVSEWKPEPFTCDDPCDALIRICGDCKRFLAGLIDTGPVPFGDPWGDECEKMIPTGGYFCDTNCSFRDHHVDCVIRRVKQ